MSNLNLKMKKENHIKIITLIFCNKNIKSNDLLKKKHIKEESTYPDNYIFKC